MKTLIKEKRTSLNMTQEELAKRLDVSRQTVISLEKGKYKPSLVLAHKLAQIFECLIEDLFIFEGMKILTETMTNTLIALAGLGIGVLGIVIIYSVNKRIGKKERLFDERQQKINYQAKALSWNITMAAILMAWTLAIIFQGISFSFFLITGLYILQCLSMLITTVYLAQKN